MTQELRFKDAVGCHPKAGVANMQCPEAQRGRAKEIGFDVVDDHDGAASRDGVLVQNAIVRARALSAVERIFSASSLLKFCDPEAYVD